MADLCSNLNWHPLLYGSDLGSDSSPAEEMERCVNLIIVLFVWGSVKISKATAATNDYFQDRLPCQRNREKLSSQYPRIA